MFLPGPANSPGNITHIIYFYRNDDLDRIKGYDLPEVERIMSHQILHIKRPTLENGKEHFCLLKKKTFELNNCFHAENTLMGFIFVNAFNFSTKFLVVKSNLLTFCILFLSCGFRH